MDIAQVITVMAAVIANIGTVIALYLQLDKKLDENRKETNDLIRAIQLEMKDFHGRLCAIEERGRK